MPDIEDPPVYLILDPSSLVRGIGNIRKWIEKFNLVIFIPDYTLRELDFMKKGISLMATNARESIRLIDKLTSLEDDFFSGPEDNRTAINLANVKAKVLIQTPDEVGPRYEKCLKFKKKTPLIKDFPNYKTEFDSLSVAGLKKAQNTKESININSRAEIPLRLRYLVRSCVQKQFVETNEDKKIEWFIITEDPITKIWLESFQLHVLDLSGLSNLLNNNSNLEAGLNYDEININKNLYNPELASRETNRKRKVKDVNKSTKEKFETMDYANRGPGQLWKP